MNLARLALRNLARNRRRTALSVAIVACGTAAIVLVAGFVRFSFDGLSEAMIRGGLGHLEVAAADEIGRRAAGTLDRPAASALADWRELRVELERLDGVAAVGATLHVMGLAQKEGGASVSFVGVGVEPARELRMGFTTRLRTGEPLAEAEPAEGEDTVLLARGLAESLGAGPGDTVTLLAAGQEGMLNALDVRVAGVYTTGVAELDSRFAKLPLTSAARLLQLDSVSNLLVVLEDTESTDAALQEVRGLIANRVLDGRRDGRRDGGRDGRPPLAVVPWYERAPFYSQVRDLYTGIFRFLGAVVLLLVVLAVSNTLVMTVFERMRELGTLRAIGTTPAQIAAILAAEAAGLGLIGAACGAVLGAVGVAAINGARLQMPPPPGAVDPIDLRLAYVPEAFVGAGVLMIAVLLAAALLPIARAVRISVVEALGSV